MRNINVILFHWQHSELDVGQNIIPVIIFLFVVVFLFVITEASVPLTLEPFCGSLVTSKSPLRKSITFNDMHIYPRLYFPGDHILNFFVHFLFLLPSEMLSQFSP
jgi:hypothetical protein